VRGKGVYVHGKFDLYLREPYFGITSAFREICVSIVQLKNLNCIKYQELCDNIFAEVGDQIALLVNISPELQEAIGITVMPNAIAEQGNKEAKERLKYAFLRFFRVVTRYLSHMVLVIDDLQWTDLSSMELLDALIRDEEISLMFIGIYRSNEVNDSHYLMKYLQGMREANESGIFMLTEISIGNLDVATCEEILVELLSQDVDDTTRSLTETCHKRTNGNVYHLLAYLAMLQEQKLLEFNIGNFKWTWDSRRIEDETTPCSNVVGLMKGKMKKQPRAVCNLLQLASCLGQSFDKYLLTYAYSKMHDGESEDLAEMEEDLDHLLSLVVDEAFLEQHTPSRFCWAHSSIQVAAMHLVNDDQMLVFKFKLAEDAFARL